MLLRKVRKRDGRVENFDSEKIFVAIQKAFTGTGEPDPKNVE
jgi:anaerobic ribonucleoside-triphosphate reductase